MENNNYTGRIRLTEINDERLRNAGPRIQKQYLSRVGIEILEELRMKNKRKRRMEFMTAVFENMKFVVIGYFIGYIISWCVIIYVLYQIYLMAFT